MRQIIYVRTLRIRVEPGADRFRRSAPSWFEPDGRRRTGAAQRHATDGVTPHPGAGAWRGLDGQGAPNAGPRRPARRRMDAERREAVGPRPTRLAGAPFSASCFARSSSSKNSRCQSGGAWGPATMPAMSGSWSEGRGGASARRARVSGPAGPPSSWPARAGPVHVAAWSVSVVLDLPSAPPGSGVEQGARQRRSEHSIVATPPLPSASSGRAAPRLQPQILRHAFDVIHRRARSLVRPTRRGCPGSRCRGCRSGWCVVGVDRHAAHPGEEAHARAEIACVVRPLGSDQGVEQRGLRTGRAAREGAVPAAVHRPVQPCQTAAVDVRQPLSSRCRADR